MSVTYRFAYLPSGWPKCLKGQSLLALSWWHVGVHLHSPASREGPDALSDPVSSSVYLMITQMMVQDSTVPVLESIRKQVNLLSIRSFKQPDDVVQGTQYLV